MKHLIFLLVLSLPLTAAATNNDGSRKAKDKKEQKLSDSFMEKCMSNPNHSRIYCLELLIGQAPTPAPATEVQVSEAPEALR